MSKKESTTPKKQSASPMLYMLSALSQDGAVLPVLVERVEQKGGIIKKTEDLGMKRLAYPINHKTDLTLVSLFFESSGLAVQQLNQELRHEDRIERFLITCWNAPLEQSERMSKMKMADGKVGARVVRTEPEKVETNV